MQAMQRAGHERSVRCAQQAPGWLRETALRRLYSIEDLAVDEASTSMMRPFGKPPPSAISSVRAPLDTCSLQTRTKCSDTMGDAAVHSTLHACSSRPLIGGVTHSHFLRRGAHAHQAALAEARVDVADDAIESLGLRNRTARQAWAAEPAADIAF